MQRLRIAMLAPITGSSRSMGGGFRDSADFCLEQMAPDLAAAGLALDFLVIDYCSDAATAMRAAEACSTGEEIAAILGPCDSASAYEILRLHSPRAKQMPIVTPLATSTSLTQMGAKNFFRVTTPDSLRAVALVDYIATHHPGALLRVWALEGAANSYSQSLKADVTRVLLKRGIRRLQEDFKSDALPNNVPSIHDPVIMCCPSLETIRLVTALLRRNIKAPIFSFGSNSNLLIKEMTNAVVVADLDRNDSDPTTSEILRQFEINYGFTSDPSLATMNAVAIICKLLIKHRAEIREGHIIALRQLIADSLTADVQYGLTERPYTFTPNGEMIGHEHICILSVVPTHDAYVFAIAERITTTAVVGGNRAIAWLQFSKGLVRLRENRVTRWIIAYALFALGVLHGAELIEHSLELPTLVSRVVTIALFLGGVIAAVFAWIHENRARRHERLLIVLVLVLATALGVTLAPWFKSTWHTLMDTAEGVSPSTSGGAAPKKF